MPDLRFYFDYLSPYAYLAQSQLRAIGHPIAYRPFDIRTLMRAVGNVPTSVVCKPKNRYVTGNTSALHGRPNFAGFAPTKAAQRILAESIAREMGPQGVHVAYLVIDAVIDLAWTRERFPDRPDDAFIAPAAVADEVWHLAHQPRSAWSFLTEIRPFGETW